MTPADRVGARFLALGGGETVARLCAFAATVYLARTLSPALYGVVSVAAGVMLYLTQVADGGIELVGIPFIARARAQLAAFVAPILAVRALMALGLCALTVAIALLALPAPDGAVLAITSGSLLATALSTRWVLLGLERPGAVGLSRVAGELLALVLVLLLVRGPDDLLVAPVAAVAGAVVTTLVLLATLRRLGHRVAVRWAPTEAGPVFARSRHLLGFTVLGLLLFNFDLIYLRFQVGAADAGLYAAAYTLIAFAANLIVAFAHTVLPALTRLERDPAARSALFQTSCAQAFALALPVGIGAWFVAAQVIEQVFGAAYIAAASALAWLAWSIPLAALRELPVVALIAAGGERRLLRVNALTVAANVALVVALVPRFGLVGAAAATVATELIRLFLATRYAVAAGFPVLAAARLSRPVLAGGVMAVTLLTIRPDVLWYSVPLGAAVYAVVMAALGGVRWRGAIPELRV